MEFFAFDLGDGTVALVPFPPDLPLEARAGYLAAPPADAVASARRERADLFGITPLPATPAAPSAPLEPAALFTDDDSEG